MKNLISQKTHCSVCAMKLSEALIDLPSFPLTGVYAKKLLPQYSQGIDQSFFLCPQCGHGQLGHCVSPQLLYGPEYSFRTKNSATAKAGTEIFISFSKKIFADKKFNCILDVGCNDLLLLNSLKPQAKQLVGIDPIWADEGPKGQDPKIKLIGKTVEDVDLAEFLNSQPELILCRHTLEHISSPKDVLKKLYQISSEEALFVFEFPGLEFMVKAFRFDRIIHEHLQYFSLNSFKWLLEELGFQFLSFDVNYGHWGSILIAFQKTKRMKTDKTIRGKFSAKFHEELREKIENHFEIFQRQLHSAGQQVRSIKDGPVIGFGASHLLPVLFYYSEMDASCLKVILDDDHQKNNLQYANLDVRIRLPKISDDIPDRYVVITALDHVRKIVARIEPYHPKQVIVPLNIF